VVIGVDTHDPSAVVALLAKHVRDYNSKGLQGHACEYTTRTMAKMLYSNINGLCLTVPLAVAKGEIWIVQSIFLPFLYYSSNFAKLKAGFIL
jgi:hypothetical protein